MRNEVAFDEKTAVKAALRRAYAHALLAALDATFTLATLYDEPEAAGALRSAYEHLASGEYPLDMSISMALDALHSTSEATRTQPGPSVTAATPRLAREHVTRTNTSAPPPGAGHEEKIWDGDGNHLGMIQAHEGQHYAFTPDGDWIFAGKDYDDALDALRRHAERGLRDAKHTERLAEMLATLERVGNDHDLPYDEMMVRYQANLLGIEDEVERRAQEIIASDREEDALDSQP